MGYPTFILARCVVSLSPGKIEKIQEEVSYAQKATTIVTLFCSWCAKCDVFEPARCLSTQQKMPGWSHNSLGGGNQARFGVPANWDTSLLQY